MSWGSRSVTTVAQVTALAWVHSLAQELPHPESVAKKEKNIHILYVCVCVCVYFFATLLKYAQVVI